MNRIIAAVELVINLCIRKAGVPLLWCLVLYLIGMGALVLALLLNKPLLRPWLWQHWPNGNPNPLPHAPRC